MGNSEGVFRLKRVRFPDFWSENVGGFSRGERSECTAVHGSARQCSAVLGSARLGSAGLGADAALFFFLRWMDFEEAPLALFLGPWRHSARALCQWRNQVCCGVL